jgi:hypothetical protein
MPQALPRYANSVSQDKNQKMKLRITFLAFLLGAVVLSASAQPQLHVKSGISASSFFFKNAKGETEKNLQYLMGNYTAIGCDAHFGAHAIRSELGYRQAGAAQYLYKTKLSWNLKYIDLNAGYEYNYFRSKRIALGLGTAINLGIMLQGEQRTGSETYNVLKEKALREIDFGANAFTNAKVRMAEGLYLTLEYRYNVSVLNIETDKALPAQTTRNQSHNFLVGIAISLNKAGKSAAQKTDAENNTPKATP